MRDSLRGRTFRRKGVRAAIGAVIVLAVVGLWAFEPWRLFTSSTIDEALPIPAATEPAIPAGGVPIAPPEPVELAVGEFVTQEHDTSGQARVLRLPDGSRVLRLTDLSTSDGPDLHVWLADATAGGEWGKYDEGRMVRLGELKATHGNQNYEIPADATLDGLRSVVVWCDRFDVAFGSAPLDL
ncbi:hypothetical protein CFN78_09745 [Amycolatopsis antarctica]|uniref:DM13 domain-containing protein n=1 Tax=Amycolatopsis antarctica TaxID=1854586 RepID=A0A263D4X0_9PSEU|nr:DM13 domain-containing protein [Amycolatopsis antarctica]OZM73421.1 hypothetical protein CFN78_09745 [Amycolatopsis antarctica]